MMTFYAIIDNKLQIGSGTTIPEGFIEYTVGAEPQELLDIQLSEQTANDLAVNIAAARKYLADTDWYFVRQIEENIAVPQEILDERMVQKTFIRDNEI
jgi:hypothetical protein